MFISTSKQVLLLHKKAPTDSCGEASPSVGVGNGEFDPLPSGNGESAAKDFYLFAYISNQKMIISGYT